MNIGNDITVFITLVCLSVLSAYLSKLLVIVKKYGHEAGAVVAYLVFLAIDVSSQQFLRKVFENLAQR